MMIYFFLCPDLNDGCCYMEPLKKQTFSVIYFKLKAIFFIFFLNLSLLKFQIRTFQTSAIQRDIDQAAKYIGAGAATVGVAGSGKYFISNQVDT